MASERTNIKKKSLLGTMGLKSGKINKEGSDTGVIRNKGKTNTMFKSNQSTSIREKDRR